MMGMLLPFLMFVPILWNEKLGFRRFTDVERLGWFHAFAEMGRAMNIAGIPDDYDEQHLQAFIVNSKLERLHFTFYTDLIPARPLHVITVKREDVAERLAEMREYELKTVKLIDELVEWFVL